MPKQPTIIVQLIHIQGPLKGTIQEFSDPEIAIGRHPSCQVQFPKDLATISRRHARIIREGNRFKLIDESANGTFIRGKRVTETYLNSGDVLIFAEENGPKVSFLAEIRSDTAVPPIPQPPRPPVRPYQPAAEKEAATPHANNDRTFEMGQESISANDRPFVSPVDAAPPFGIEKVKVPLAIQYGPTLKAYKELPITMGRHPDCDFPLEHPDILDRHVQIFFSKDRYGIKDLTGKRMVRVNGSPFDNHAFLSPNDRLRLGPKGPSFQFLAGGRLAEIEEPGSGTSDAGEAEPAATGSTPKDAPKGRSMIDKLFNR